MHNNTDINTSTRAKKRNITVSQILMKKW